jgi:hypothetical protein
MTDRSESTAASLIAAPTGEYRSEIGLPEWITE